MKYFLTLCSLVFMACNFSKTHQQGQDWTFSEFVKQDSVNPILLPDTSFSFDCPVSNHKVLWQSKNVLNPTALIKDGKVYLIYRAQDSAMTSRLGLAISEDGIHFTKQAAPTTIIFKEIYLLK
jgi:predicted GH43/DUF377 family glycosyl hydrolase